jgi:uncharacterized membrane protein YccC
MKIFNRWIKGDMHGIHYALSMFIATALLWAVLRRIPGTNPIWAISSMVATSDPVMKQAVLTFRSRIINVSVGCLVGLLFIAIGGHRVLTLPLAMAASVLISSYFVRIQTMWRQIPITAAFVIAASLQHHARLPGLVAGARRVCEVLFGCVVGIVVAWMISKAWPLSSSAPPASSAARP